MDPVRFDRLAKLVAHRPLPPGTPGARPRGAGRSGAAVMAGGVAAKPPTSPPPRGPVCLEGAQLCTHTDECCPATTSRVSGQNGCAHPDRPRCCAGVGGACHQSCECCGFDLDCVAGHCVYAPR